MAESIELQIESDARGAVKSIGNLETKLSSLGKTLSSINTSNLHSFSSGLKELSVSMGSLSKIDTRTFTKVAKNIKKIVNDVIKNNMSYFNMYAWDNTSSNR